MSPIRAADPLDESMAVTVLLELKFKPDSVVDAREVFGKALEATRSFAGNLVTKVIVDETDEAHWIIYERWESVEHDEAYRAFRAGEGKIDDLPPLLAAPPVKTRYLDTEI
ncbi:hypothetical protein MSMEI_6708 [Mycolicibacterium smegmatis MC2 155]|uniref:ABM domain-containing protein n=4 Tax=Mycolicibacterium smegmatis TaxID=1772 RepID=I7GGR8_MYCS2|nr:hypothetical protein MSMEI_6708 [Mycolicibacterium smegmatis MC2 155]